MLAKRGLIKNLSGTNLHLSGFVVEEKWTELISLLGVSLDERRRLKTMANTAHDYHFALEEGLQWWINYSSTASWSPQLLINVKTVVINYNEKRDWNWLVK